MVPPEGKRVGISRRCNNRRSGHDRQDGITPIATEHWRIDDARLAQEQHDQWHLEEDAEGEGHHQHEGEIPLDRELQARRPEAHQEGQAKRQDQGIAE